MTPLTVCIIAIPCLFIFITLCYRLFSKGLSDSAKWQQTTRFAIGSVIAMAPWIAACPAVELTSGAVAAAVISLGWSVTFPILSWLTNRRVSSDIDHYMDFSTGLYIFAMLGGALLLNAGLLGNSAAGLAVIFIAELLLLVPPAVQIVYYGLYGGAIDDVGMKVIVDTNVNEVIEFTRAFSLPATLAVTVAAAGVAALLGWADLASAPSCAPLEWWQGCIIAAAMALAAFTALRPRKGALLRAGIVKLYNDVRQYERSTRLFRESRAEALASLRVERLGTPETLADTTPHTLMLIIGESASRDYMKAFNPDEPLPTTPWLSARAADDPRHFILFPNSYSCAFQTVPALERALTEMNQYNSLEFHRSLSIVDMAHALGYKVTWFSNQGHIGVADTSVSIVAETSDRAQWTRQEIGRPHYDESLLELLKEVDPAVNNFVVLHLKGSHFNFINRYPAEHTEWGEPGVQDNLLNYKNSIRYTDFILERAFDYARSNLNLRAMVYFSDHATIPDKRRSPRFDGYGQCCIPLMVYLSEEYISGHAGRHAALQANSERYFTNDLAYELLCGIFDIASVHFDETASLASPAYRFRREMLRTYLGTKPLQ